MAMILDGSNGLTTPGVVNTAGETIATTLAVTGATNLSALTTTGNTILGDASTDTLNVGNGGLIKDASGNVGIGTVPNAWSSSSNALQNSGGALWQFGSSNFYVGQNYYFNGTNRIYTTTAEATEYQQGAGTHRWFTAPSGTAGTTATFTERMRIDSSGNLLVGTTNNLVWNTTNTGIALGSGANPAIQVSRDGDIALLLNRLTSDGQIAVFARQGTLVGAIAVTTTATAYNTSSDYRLKEAIAPMTGALAKVALLKPCTYKWNVNGSDSEGFIAHELAEVVPHAVTGEKDAVQEEQYEVTPAVKDEEGNIVTEAVMGTRTVPSYQGIDTSFLVATLTAAIQELKAIVDAQAVRIAALES